MIAVLVRFRYESGFSEARVRQVAEAARAKFDGRPELRSKAFTIDPVNRESLNFYVWESEMSAKAFFSQQLIDRVTELYGVRPIVQFLDVVALVENRASRPGSDTDCGGGRAQQAAAADGRRRVGFWEFAGHCGGGRC